MVELRKKIGVAMILKDLEINDLAEELGVSRGYLSPIINGKRTGEKPNELLEKVKDILEIDNLIVCYQKDLNEIKKKQEV